MRWLPGWSLVHRLSLNQNFKPKSLLRLVPRIQFNQRNPPMHEIIKGPGHIYIFMRKWRFLDFHHSDSDKDFIFFKKQLRLSQWCTETLTEVKHFPEGHKSSGHSKRDHHTHILTHNHTLTHTALYIQMNLRRSHSQLHARPQVQWNPRCLWKLRPNQSVSDAAGDGSVWVYNGKIWQWQWQTHSRGNHPQTHVSTGVLLNPK